VPTNDACPFCLLFVFLSFLSLSFAGMVFWQKNVW